MPSSTVWLGDQRVADGSISAIDHGYLVGDGVFETLKTMDGVPFALSRHLLRLRRSATGLGLPLPDETAIRAAVAEVVDGSSLPVGRLRITVTSGPGPLGSSRGEGPSTLVVTHAAATPWPPAARLAAVRWTRNERAATAGLKTTSYAENVIALDAAHRAGADEALFTDTRGRICEGTGSNLFYVVNGHLVTPSLATGCLAGVTRELVLELVDAMVADAPVALLDGADEAFLTSSTRDVLPVSHLDGRPFPSCPGPRTVETMAALSRLQDATLDP
jgi:branched-chain amino acid aminotransferase